MLKSISYTVTGLLILSSTAFAERAPITELPDLTGIYSAVLQTCMTPGASAQRIKQELKDTFVRLDTIKPTEGSILNDPKIATIEVRVGNRTASLSHSLLRLYKTAAAPDFFSGSNFKLNAANKFEPGTQSALIFSNLGAANMFSVNELMVEGKTNVIGSNMCAPGEVSTVFMFQTTTDAISK